LNRSSCAAKKAMDAAGFVAAGVAAVAVIEQFRFPAFLFGEMNDGEDRPGAAGGFRAEAGFQIEDALDAIGVHRARLVVRMIMAEVGAGHDDALCVELVGQHLRDVRRVHVAEHHRHQLEVLEHFLQERHHDLAGVFPRVRFVRALRRRLGG